MCFCFTEIMKATLFIKTAVVLSLSLSVAPPPLQGASVQSSSGKAAAVSLMRTELCSSSSSSSGVNCNGASLGCSQRQQFCTASGRERKIKAERREGGGGGGLLSRSQKLWKRLRLAGRRFSTTGCLSLVFIRQLRRRRFVSARLSLNGSCKNFSKAVGRSPRVASVIVIDSSGFFFFVCYRGTQDVSTLKPPFLNSPLAASVPWMLH